VTNCRGIAPPIQSMVAEERSAAGAYDPTGPEYRDGAGPEDSQLAFTRQRPQVRELPG